MTRLSSTLAFVGIACLLATTAMARPDNSQDNPQDTTNNPQDSKNITVAMGTPTSCELPFFSRKKYWSTCISLGSTDDKPWCMLKKGYVSQNAKSPEWAYCDMKTFHAPGAIVDGVRKDCLPQKVKNETYMGCSADTKNGIFQCLVDVGGKQDYRACLSVKQNLESVDSVSKAALVTENTDSPNKSSIGLGGVLGITFFVGAIALLAGLFVYRRRQSRQSMSMQYEDRSMQRIDPSTIGTELTVPMTAASTSRINNDTSSYYGSEENSQILSPLSPTECLYPVVSTYTPTLGDELEIQPGDKVGILIEYDDGWCQGVNHTRGGLKGVFPRHCVDMTAGMPVDDADKTVNSSTATIAV